VPIDVGRVRPRNVRSWWITVAVMVAVLTGLTVAVDRAWGPLLSADKTVAEWAHDLTYGHGGFVDVLLTVRIAAAPLTLRALLLVIAAALAWRQAWRLSGWLLTVVAVEWLVAPAFKVALDRPRPSWDAPITTVGGFSFPSGHAAGGGMFATAIVLLAVAMLYRSRLRRTLCALGLAVGVAAGLDRIFLGVHYLSDVVAGWLLGTVIVLIGWLVVMRPGAVLPPLAVTDAVGARLSRFAVIVNPVHTGDATAFQASVAAAATRWGWDAPLWYETRADDPGVSMSEQALAAGVQMVLVAGGDGTVRVVCAELARTGVAVGIVPLGTGNLLARNLGLPLHPAEAVETALSGQDRAVDVVAVHGDDLPETCFTVMAGLGLDAAIMAGAPDELKARMGWPAYVVSALRQLRHPATWVEVRVDGGPPVRRKARTVVVGNVGSLQAGIPLLPDALIDDGRLDVVVIAPQHTVGWLRLVLRVLRRTRRTDERLDRMTGRRVSVRAEKPLLRQLDGDPVGEGEELHAQVLAGTLLVRVPR